VHRREREEREWGQWQGAAIDDRERTEGDGDGGRGKEAIVIL
jgi:hypothetical protein